MKKPIDIANDQLELVAKMMEIAKQCGREEATKEILEEVNNSGFEMKNEIGNDHYFIIPSDNWRILKQQLKKLGENKQ